jgi:serine/threonine protein kinase
MGEVYRGRDTRLGRDVALKVISPKLVGNETSRHRFEREARAASALNHPAIVTVYDVGETEGVSWIAMEWVDGRTLRQVFADGPLPLHDAWSIARQIAEGLAAAHAKGVIHRDLKPENVIIATDGRVRILDFGLARQTVTEGFESSLEAAETMLAIGATVEGVILGTVGYMSPEQAAGGAVDFRSDQFAFGLLVYEMLSGRRAFAHASAVETLWATIRENPVPLGSLRSGIPEALERVVARCLSKKPEERFASTRDLVAALESAEAGLLETPAPTVVLPPEAPVVVARRATRLRDAAVVVAVILIVTAMAMSWKVLTTSDAIDSLAVLPFENRSTDPDSNYLGDELTESLINQMVRVPSLKVPARRCSATRARPIR